MPVRPVRRLDRPSESLYDQMSEHPLSATWSRSEVEATEREHPDLVLRRDGNVLLAIDHHDVAALGYAYEGEREFVELFPAMFEQLLPRIRRVLGADVARFRLTYNPARPKIEPVLRNLWFSPRPSWLEFTLEKKAVPKLPATRGVKFRDGGIGDLEDMVRIDRESFPDTPVPRDAMRERIESGERVLVATGRGGAVIGYAIYFMAGEGDGYLHTLAVTESERRRGIGAALTVRAAKKLFAEGVANVRLRTEEDNGAAIRLYVSLGFKQTSAGRDYSRPTDPRAIQRIKKTSEGTLIRFGGWR